MVLVLVHTESTQSVLRSTQNLHRRFGVHTESTQTSQFRVYTEQFWVYTESTQNDSVSIQSLYRSVDLDRVYKEQFGICIKSTESIRDLHRVYTETRSELIWVYSESTQDNTDLHKFYTEQFLVFTESRKSNSRLQRVYTDHLESKGLHRVFRRLHRVYTESI